MATFTSLLEQEAFQILSPMGRWHVPALPFCTLVGVVTPNSQIYQVGVVFSRIQPLFLLFAQTLLHPAVLPPADQ